MRPAEMGQRLTGLGEELSDPSARFIDAFLNGTWKEAKQPRTEPTLEQLAQSDVGFAAELLVRQALHEAIQKEPLIEDVAVQFGDRLLIVEKNYASPDEMNSWRLANVGDQYGGPMKEFRFGEKPPGVAGDGLVGVESSKNRVWVSLAILKDGRYICGLLFTVSRGTSSSDRP